MAARKPQPRKRAAQGGKAGGKGNGKSSPKRTGNRRYTQQPKVVVYKPGENAVRVGVEHGIDLAHFLGDQLPGQWSVRAVRRFLSEGKVTVDGQVETFGSRKLRRGETVDFALPEDRNTTVFQERRLIHNDQHIAAYDKPAGLAVTPTDDGKSWHLLKLLQDELGETLFPVHRLDADTTGVVMFAKSQLAANFYEEAFREHRVHKTYLAIVRGHPKEHGERRSYLVKKAGQRGFEKWGTGRGADAREALTRWDVIDRIGAYASLVRVEPATGRHHQIRIHMSEVGHPLYGDRVYGDRRDPVLSKRQMLHASEMLIPTADGKQLKLRCRQPNDFAALKKQLLALRG